MKRYEEIKMIDEGAFGIVTKCRDRETGEVVAVKKMKQRTATFDECLQMKEVKSLRRIKHDNVMRLLQVFRENDRLFLVFEFLPDGSLLQTMRNHVGPFTEPEIRFIVSQILEGLASCHRQGFFHRDIKPENLLWSGTVLKIADFGLAREIRSRPPYTEYVSTRWYRAPEIAFRHEFYNSPVDIWAVGCIMAELFNQKPLFQGTSETDQVFRICSVLGTPGPSNWPDGVRLATRLGIRLPQTPASPLAMHVPSASPEAIDLLKELLQLDPVRRISAVQALQHLWFRGEVTPVAMDGGNIAGESSRPRPGPEAEKPTEKGRGKPSLLAVVTATQPVPAIPAALPVRAQPITTLLSDDGTPEFDDIFEGIDT
jgi:protein kinase